MAVIGGIRVSMVGNNDKVGGPVFTYLWLDSLVQVIKTLGLWEDEAWNL